MNQFGPYYRKRSRSCGPRPVSSPRQCPIRRSRSLSSLPYFNNTEGVRYEGNLRSFYNLDTRDDQRILALNHMREEIARQQRKNPNLTPFQSTIVPFYEQNKQQRKANRERIRSTLERRNSSLRAGDWNRRRLIRQPNFNECFFRGTVYNDDNDLYRKLDDQWRQEYEENEQAQINKRFGYGYDNSYSVHHRYQMPVFQRTPTLRDNLYRTRANYMIHESQKPRYLRNRPQRIAQRLEDYRLWNTMHESRPLQGIQEVSPQKEKYWDYDLDELDSSF